MAASLYCPLVKLVLNFLMNNSSAPPRLFLTANLSAMSGFWRLPLM